jgi:NAD(P)-dependent dehydrogenase (short-subunit alcohol dehydrogenase family)
MLTRRARRLNLVGKTVLITGGSRGLGLVLAREFAAHGSRVAICARDRAELDRAADDLKGCRGCVALQCDLADPAAIDAMVAQIERDLGPVDVLVNNAGVIQVGPAEVMTDEDYRESMDIHFWAPLHCIRAVLPSMLSRRTGRIVNISSIGGKVSVPHLSPYCAGKFALVGLSEGLRVELARRGVTVTTICPGLMRTGSPRNATFKGRNRAEFAWFSIAAGLPGLTISAESAARRIIAACVRGEAEVVLSLPAKILAKVHGLFPGATQDGLALVNRMLPAPGGIGAHRAQGKESTSFWSPSWLTLLSDKAAHEYNEVEPARHPG